VPGDPYCDCWAYTPEERAKLLQALEDSKADRCFRASVEDLTALADGRMDVRDFQLREFLATTEGVQPRELEPVQ